MANFATLMTDDYAEQPRITGMVDIRDVSEQSANLYDGGVYRSDYESMSSRKEATPLSHRFFSENNKKKIHNQIRYQVYLKTDRVIEKQSDIDLHILMTSIYDEFAGNTDCIEKDIENLNVKVIDNAVRIIVVNLKQYLSFVIDKSSYPVPLDRPTNESIKGQNTFESVPF